MMSVILQRSLAALKATGAKYIIVMPDGTVHTQGDLKLASEEKPKRKRCVDHPYGTITAYYMPYINDLEPGNIVEIPFDRFKPEVLISGISSRAVTWWGKGSVVTAQNKQKKVVEVMRVV